MTRFFMAGSNLAGGVAVIKGKDAEHVKVLRMKLGERFIICDGEGTDYKCRLTMVGDRVEAEIEGSEPTPAEASIRAAVLAGLPKGDRADYIVQKCTEAGADEIVFFVSERSVSRPDGKGMKKKIDRLQRIAEEAAKQSGRGVIPRVLHADGIAGALDIAVKTELPMLMYETGERRTLRSVLEEADEFKSVSIITGPEGGFEQYEVDIARAAGLKICTMGPRILRCETAPLCALTAVMYHTDNM